MDATNKLPATPSGWILGAECGYRHHMGFVKDCANNRDHFSLVPGEKGWVLSRIVNRIAETSTTFSTLEEAVEYVG